MTGLPRYWYNYRSIYHLYQGGPIDHCTHVPVPVDQSSSEREYNATFTAGMDLEYFSMLNNGLLNKD